MNGHGDDGPYVVCGHNTTLQDAARGSHLTQRACSWVQPCAVVCRRRPLAGGPLDGVQVVSGWRWPQSAPGRGAWRAASEAQVCPNSDLTIARKRRDGQRNAESPSDAELQLIHGAHDASPQAPTPMRGCFFSIFAALVPNRARRRSSKTLGLHCSSSSHNTTYTRYRIPPQPAHFTSRPRASPPAAAAATPPAMASSDPYADSDTQMGGPAGLYAVGQNGGTSPAQQQQQHMHTDPDLQLRENLQQLQRNTEMMHPQGPPQHQMNALNPAHHQFQTPPRPTHSPQQMAQSVMSLEEHNMYGDHDASSRKRSKVSRACDECRRKKVPLRHLPRLGAMLTIGRFGATRPVRTARRLARAASAPARVASSADSQ